MSYVLKRLEGSDVKYTSHEVYKTWLIGNDNYTDYGISFIYGNYTSSIFSETDPQVSDIYQRNVFNSLHKLYYKHFNTDPHGSYGLNNPHEYRVHQGYIEALSIPSKIIGERIKPGSIQLAFSQLLTDGVTAVDDGFGNIVVVNSGLIQPTFIYGYTTSSYLSNEVPLADQSSDGLVCGFISSYTMWEYIHKPTQRSFQLPLIGSANLKAICYNAHATSSLYWYPIAFESDYDLGESQRRTFIQITDRALDHGDSMISNVDDKHLLNFENDFTLQLTINVRQAMLDYLTGELVQEPVGLITKNFYIPHISYNNQTGFDELSINSFNKKSPTYPYELLLNPSDKSLTFKASDGQRHTVINSSANAITTDEYDSIIVTKSGSLVSIYIDGVLETSGQYISTGDTSNDSDLLIGGHYMQVAMPTYDISSFRCYNRCLSANEIASIANDSINNTAVIGNVIYNHGIITLTHPLYRDAFNPTNTWQLQYKSTKTINELEVNCTVSDADLNVTQNDSIRLFDTGSIGRVKDIATGSYFRPYITTVGCYNDEGDLLMVGKMAQPIPKPYNMDTTFILKLDIPS